VIKEIVTHLKDEELEITFRMDSGYFDDAILLNLPKKSFQMPQFLKVDHQQ
jgi:hypothetical protein